MNKMISKIFSFIFVVNFLSASQVTLHVDMNGQTVSANGVHVAGNFGDYDYDNTFENPAYPNWDPAGIALTDDDSDGVYSVTLDLVPGTIEYKFINGNAWGGENDDEWAGEDNDNQPCRSGGGNRTITIGETDLDVGLVCWERCIPCGEVYVTLRVDMEYETVSDSGVHVAGNFQGWDPATTMMAAENDSSTVYHYQFGSTPGTELQYKFVNGNTWDDAETVPADCATGGNRTHVVGETDFVADAICYNQCGTCTPPATAAVTFQADMSQLLSYGFDPSIHTLELRGPMNGWSGGDEFVVDALDPNLYAFTKEVTAVPGDPVEWKFKANPDASWNNSGWETSANRTFVFSGEAQVLDPEVPAILPTGELQNEVTVDMAVTWREGTLNANDGSAFPQAPDTIIFNGSFLNCWCTWGDCMGVSCATAVSSEIPRLVDTDGDGVYTGSLTLPAGHNNVITYKFGAYYPGVESIPGGNGAMDNEAGFGADRVLYIPSQTSGNIALETTFGENNPDNPWLNITSSQVTLHVDMNGQTVSANGVHVAGNFGDYDYDNTFENPAYPNWDPAGIALTDDDSDGVYSVTLDLVPGTIEYKFINGNAWGGENDDEWAGEDNDNQPCRSGGGNRTITIGETDLDVGLVCWERCIPCGEVYVTLRVDMEYETVSDSGVHVAGNFQGWDPATTMMAAENDSSTVYHYQFGSTPGTELQYKFVNGNTWDDAETVPADCATGGNRTHVVGETDFVADAICYNQCGTCTPPATAAVTFQADMSQLLSYGFDPSIHTLELRGPMNGWSGGDEFVVDALDPNLYAFTKEVTAVPGDPVEWKFKANPDASWNNSGWETSANRTFVFSGEAQVLDPEVPAILPTGELQNEVTVDMAVTWREGTLNANDGSAFPQAPDTIIFNGSFLNCWCTWGDCMGVSCATAVSSEIPRLVDTDGDGVYTGSLTLPAGHNNVITYKFGAYYPGVESIPGGNGAMDNEAGFGADRVLYIPSQTSGNIALETTFGENNPDNPWLLSTDDFASQPNEFKLKGNYPNPFNPVTTINFTLDITSELSMSIYNVKGESVREIKMGQIPSGVHSVVWDSKDNSGRLVSTGLYLYTIQSNGRTLNGKMLFMK